MRPVATPAPVSYSQLGRRVHPPTIARLMTMALDNPRLLSLAAGFTDTSTLPTRAVGAAVAALTRDGQERECLQYGPNLGRAGLRRLLGERLRGLESAFADVDLDRQLLITNGSQQALYLATQVLCDPGDIVLVDRPSYFVFLEMLAGLGVEARSLPVDAQGRLDTVGLRQLLQGLRQAGELPRVKALYLVSYFSNPSGRSLSPAEKDELGEVLRLEGMRMPVIEDAAYRELYYDQPSPARSVFSGEAWSEHPKLYLSTLTKPFATGLKVGYGVCSDPEWLAKMLYVKGHHDFGTANFNQAIFERVLADGGFEEHLAVIRPRYQHKMEVLHETLHESGLERLGWAWEVPAGGLYLWLRAPEGLDTGMDGAFCAASVEAGVIYVPGELCFGDAAPPNFVRLSFGVLAEAELAEAAKRFAQVAARFAP
jgi:2-aminoadipate transaminase